MAKRSSGSSQAMYVISIAAELAGVHPQTLRVYERKGLLHPHRTEGNTRRYSDRDIDRLKRIQELTQEGVNLAGVLRIMALENEVERLRSAHDRVQDDLDRARAEVQEAIGARDSGSLVPLRDVRRVRRAMKADFIEQATRRRTIAAPPVEEI